jgi:hypothetical protein
MEGPKCKLCGERHWGLCGEPPNYEPPCSYEETLRKAQEIRDGAGQSAGWGWDLPARVEPKPSLPMSPRFDRTAYQREYMRKWRAARKEAQRREALKAHPLLMWKPTWKEEPK